MSVLEFAKPESFFNSSLLPDGSIHWSEAKDHIDEYVTIYGEIASTYFDWRQYDRECELWAAYPDIEIKIPPTFIEVGAKYPDRELLKVVIWGRDRSSFQQAPDSLYRDKAVLIKGKPYIYNDLVHVNVTNPAGMIIVEPIEGLYRGWGPSDANCKSVFKVRSVRDEDYKPEGYEEYTPREPVYFDTYTGNTVSEVGDYFYDDEGNCLDSSVVGKRYDPYW